MRHGVFVDRIGHVIGFTTLTSGRVSVLCKRLGTCYRVLEVSLFTVLRRRGGGCGW